MKTIEPKFFPGDVIRFINRHGTRATYHAWTVAESHPKTQRYWLQRWNDKNKVERKPLEFKKQFDYERVFDQKPCWPKK
ncbi:MAG TPA: hypothetical protein VN038_01345 [Dyadobacter sp.]|nr:hypothetical protein [Dyadobacter sp.]